MNKKTLIISIAVIVIILAVAAFFIWKNISGEKSWQKVGDYFKKALDSAIKGVLPSINTNALENKPDLNPADKANPFKDIKTNPFQ